MNVLIGVGAQVRLARVLLVTDTRADRGDLGEFLEATLTGGVDLVQIREPGLDHEAELAALRQAWHIASRHRHLVVVSDSAGLATDFGADLVHLADPSTGDLAGFRKQLGRFTRLGGTATDSAELRRLLDEPAIDFVTVDAAGDFELAREAAEAAPVADLDAKPCFAAGEFDPDRLDAAIEAGVRRIAVSSSLTEAEDPHARAQQLSQRLRHFWADDPDLTRLTFAALADQSR